MELAADRKKFLEGDSDMGKLLHITYSYLEENHKFLTTISANMLDLPPVKVKGLIKGLRYISQIFDGEKEQEMVIGNPTDVKHVAHIGADGPAVANPSWMSDYHSAPLSSSFGHDAKEIGSPKSASQEIPLGGGSCSLSSPKNSKSESPRPRRTRRHTSSGSTPSDSPARDRSSNGSNHNRKHRSSASSENVDDRDGSTRDGSTREGSTRRGRRHRQKSDDSTDAQPESESSISDLPAIPKQSRRRERKSRLSDGGTIDSSVRSKNRSVPVSQQV